MKSIIKEIFIIILLIIIILLGLCIIFYDYNPTSKKVPSTVSAYVLDNDVQEELDASIKEDGIQNTIQTYQVTSSDLLYYKRAGDYVQGKVNPFSDVEESGSTPDSNDENNTVSANNSSNTTNTNSGQGNFLKNVVK